MAKCKNLWILIVIVPILLYLELYLAAFLPQLGSAGAASSFVNDTAIALLNVTNYAPRVYNVIVDDLVISPPNEVDLVSGYVKKVYCNGTVVDLNGKDDIYAVNATVFFTANKSRSADDKNEHYSNRSCAIIRSNVFNRTYSCTFMVWFFANNGSWVCNMSAWDVPMKGISAFNSSTDGTKINPMYGLIVPPIINYGELTLNHSSTSDKIENVTNSGNMNIDITLHGYGGSVSLENNLSMRCTLGNISIRNQKVALTSGIAYSSMTNLSGQFANPNRLTTFNLMQRKSETVNSTRNTYWKIGVPSYGVKGQCNGTIVFEQHWTFE